MSAFWENKSNTVLPAFQPSINSIGTRCVRTGITPVWRETGLKYRERRRADDNIAGLKSPWRTLFPQAFRRGAYAVHKSGRCIQIGLWKFCPHLIADFVQKRRTLGVYFQLNVQNCSKSSSVLSGFSCIICCMVLPLINSRNDAHFPSICRPS